MALDLYSLRVDRQRETDGQWIDFPELIDEQTGEVPALLVRGIGYGPYQAALSEAQRRLDQQYISKGRPVPADVNHRELGRLYAEHILLGWRHFEPPYDREVARQWLLNPESRPIHELIRVAANRVGQVEAEWVQDAAKNSSRSSDGSLMAAAK